MMRYAIVLERAKSNYAAYVPDLPGCVATGRTVKETEKRLREAIEIQCRGCARTGCQSQSRVAPANHGNRCRLAVVG